MYTHFQQTAAQNHARVFPNNEAFIFYSSNSTSFESVFWMKTVKYWLFKKYLKRTKSRATFCLSLAWLHTNAKKLLKTAILMVQELLKKENRKSSLFLVRLWPWFYPYSESLKKANYMYWKILELVHLRSCLKRYSETLTETGYYLLCLDQMR